MMRLAVELYGTVVGMLEGDSRTFDFTPTDEGIDRFTRSSTVLSVAIPLDLSPRRDHARRRRNWFGEILPEGDQYEYMLQQGGLRRGDTLSFLARFGRDVAGAVQVWNFDDPTEPPTPRTRPLTREEVRALLEDPIASPLANTSRLGKTSLGGVQPKIVLVRNEHEHEWSQALGGYPSTHIIKPQLKDGLASVIYDEEYGLRLARKIGVASSSAWVDDFDGLHALVIERFDRVNEERLHQEDLNQALGASGNEKYQELGGVVSLKRVADMLIRHTSGDDVDRLAKMVVFATAIGNLDMHTKNLGILHPADGGATLAPAYDTVPQAHMGNDGRMALAINRKYRHADLTAEDLRIEFASWGVRRAPELVSSTLEDIQTALQSESPIHGAFPELREQLLGFTENLLQGERVGGKA